MIWDLIEQSQFDKHFSNEDLTVTQLLLDQSIITQLKNQNPKLLDYINSHKKTFISQLIDYTITMPQQSDGYDRCHKLPYISSELLAIDSELIYQQFFVKDANELQNHFWLQLLQFLDRSAAQNEILMGYFEKVINNLYNGDKIKTTRVIANYLSQFTKLIHNGSIGDILKKCIILLNTPEGEVLIQRQKILKQIVSRFVNGKQEEKNICSQVLIDIINKFQAFSSGDLLVDKLLSNQQIYCIYTQQHNSAVNNFLINLVKKSQQRTINQKDESVRLLTIPQRHYQSLSKYIGMQIQGIDELISNSQYIKNQNKVLVRKSNSKIYSILSLVSLCIEEGMYGFITSTFISNLWKLVILYPYNNILQVNILKIFSNILKAPNHPINNIFLNHYEQYALQLYQSNFQMFRPFIFTVWKEAKVHQSQTKDEEIIKKFAIFVETHLQPMLKYQIKNNLKSNQTPHKLIVDQQDKPTQSVQSNNYTQQQESETVIAKSPEPTTEHVQTEPKKDDFDYFSGWQNQDKGNKKAEEGPKTNMFDDFTSFF